MVLRTLSVVLLVASCMPQTPAVKLTERTPIYTLLLLEYDNRLRVDEAPPMVSEEVATTLAERNLDAQRAPHEDYASTFANMRDSVQRIERVARQSPHPFVLLVETKAIFFSQLRGRYKWSVQARLIIADRTKPREALRVDVDFPAILDFDHEREEEALERVAPLVADEVGILVDRFLGGREDLQKVLPDPQAKLDDYDAIYFVMVDRFQNGDAQNDRGIDPKDPQAWHGGDLRGVINNLDQLQAMGIRTIWLSPLAASRQQPFHGHGAFHGYWVEDPMRLEPHFGSFDDLAELSAALKKRRMRLVLDMVLNHVSYDAPLVAEKPEWFHPPGRIKDWNDPTELTNAQVHGLPDLAQERDDVYQYLVALSRHWIKEASPAGFRLDAVKHVPISFWQRYNAELQQLEGEDFFLLGEMFDGNPATLAATLHEGRFSHLFDFPSHYALKEVFCDDKPVQKLGATLFADRIYDDPRRLVTFLDNHDLPRIYSACHDDLLRVRDALTTMMVIRGTPSVP